MIYKWVGDLQRALDTGNENIIANVPLVDLHCHSITSAPFEAFQKLSQDLQRPPRYFKNIEKFNLYLKQEINPLIKDIDTIRFLLRSTFQRLINEGVIYTEISFDLNIPSFIGVSVEEYLEAINEEKKYVSKKLKVCIEAGLDREINPQGSFELLKRALKKNIISSIDLYGNERAVPIKDFIDLYKLADRHGLKLKAHVGELGSALGIKEAVEQLNLDAVQHGIRAIDDLSVVEFLVKRGTTLNICPFSNLSLGLVKNIVSHPIQELFNAGVKITIGSDDFSIFGKSVGSELINLYKEKVFTEKEIRKIIENGLAQISNV